MKRLAGAVAVAAAVASLAVVAQPAGASGGRGSSPSSQKASVDARIRALTGQLDEVDAAEAGLQVRLDRTLAAKAALDARVKTLDGQLAVVGASLATAESALAVATGRVDATLDRVATLHSQQESSRQRLRDDAVGAYIGQPATGLAAIVLNTRTLGQVQQLMGYFDAVVTLHADDIARYQRMKERAAALAASQQDARRRARAGRDAVAAQRAQLDSTRQALGAARQSQAGQADSLRSLYAEEARTRADLQARLASLQAESDRIAALLRSQQGGRVSVPAGNGMLSWPIPGAPITSPFGMRYDPVIHQWMLHAGVDFGAPYGTPIHSAAAGRVVFAGWMSGYGNATVIDHGGDLATLYGHQEQILVTVGQRVSRGQVIGLVGCTGWCTGPHLHFEVRINGTPVNPLPYL